MCHLFEHNFENLKATINAERPLTQQGLLGISTASGSNFRQVKDKR